VRSPLEGQGIEEQDHFDLPEMRHPRVYVPAPEGSPMSYKEWPLWRQILVIPPGKHPDAWDIGMFVLMGAILATGVYAALQAILWVNR
jgi:hypothetical protein